MKAVRLLHAGPIAKDALNIEDIAEPEPGPGEVRLRIKACGVCRTDLHEAEGELEAPMPVIPGHQAVGVVDKLGPGASKFKLGERVGVSWLGWACGECARCREGLENLCSRAKFTGLTYPGGYAQAMTAHEAFLHRVPARYSDAEAAPLLCAGAVGWRAFRACKTHKGQRLGLYGFGSSARLILQAARHAGLEVFVFSRTEAHRRAAEQLGAFWTGEAGEHLPFPLDASIIFAPSGKLVPPALAGLRPGGKLVLAGIHMSDLPSMPYSLLWGERSIQSVANVTRDDVRHFLSEAEHFHFKVETQSYPLEKASEALVALKRGKIPASAVLTVS